MFVGMHPDLQKLNVYPVLSVFQRNPRPHYFCILNVISLLQLLDGGILLDYIFHHPGVRFSKPISTKNLPHKTYVLRPVYVA